MISLSPSSSCLLLLSLAACCAVCDDGSARCQVTDGQSIFCSISQEMRGHSKHQGHRNAHVLVIEVLCSPVRLKQKTGSRPFGGR
ncbi:hypothetical protein B0H67DRAFT_212278 [Lasiosphaeris hirsuta]|uniref:Secreted protein n=1 Tax=Lasiosphaeris hirsuta TaxID=260670 RepID=A0AA40ASA9_9PEZI|nr:hypothetical protein B0H67DRAFT_212278 [Lasiosphaeris hirsuta]